jgi:hypothetical protein
MWLHADALHLLGNMMSLWIFGNAVCAKIGNLRYLGLYVLFGVAAGVAYLLLSPGAVLGASGAISGIVGMYLVLYYQNEITCVFMIWIILPVYIRTFAISGIWLILARLLWDIVGAVALDGSGVAYFAHLGGFGAGFAIALLMCKKGWITMERYERSLLQMWEERTQGRPQESIDTAYAQLGLRRADEERQMASGPAPSPAPKAIPLPPAEPGPASSPPAAQSFIRTVCACGRAIRVTQQYAGRTVRCPSCRQQVVIPQRSDFFGPDTQPAHGTAILNRACDDLIRFLCTCGRRIKVPAQYAGRTCRCPQCNTTLRIPALPPGDNPIGA